MTAFHAQLTQWQAAYDAEPPRRITARHPAKASEATRIGLNLSDALMQYVDDGLEQTADGKGARQRPFAGAREFPVHTALLKWERKCRSKHSRHADHRGRPVCAEIAWAVIRDRCSLSWASAFVGVTEERGLEALLKAVAFMRGHQQRWMDEQTERVSHDRASCAQCMATP